MRVKKMRKKISQYYLKQISHDDLSYEIQMFEATAYKLKFGELDSLGKNVMLESFLLHSRCLLDFLYPPENLRPDDVIADDYFDEPELFRKKMLKKLPVSDYLKKKTGKRVMHLTYSRLSVENDEKIWQVGDIHDQLAGSLEIFFETISQEQKEWFKELSDFINHINNSSYKTQAF